MRQEFREVEIYNISHLDLKMYFERIFKTSHIGLSLIQISESETIFFTKFAKENGSLTTIVPSLPCCWWNFSMSSKGKSQMTSLLRTKKGSSLSVSSSRAKARGPAGKKRLQIYSFTLTEGCAIKAICKC